MAEDFTHLKAVEPLSNHEWAKEVRARVADLNELLEQAVARDVVVTGSIAMNAAYSVRGDSVDRIGMVAITLSERL